jgi:hypothetical protein
MDANRKRAPVPLGIRFRQWSRRVSMEFGSDFQSVIQSIDGIHDGKKNVRMSRKNRKAKVKFAAAPRQRNGL